jgi:pSer/pThr/pTyr-binding forkhead associated (FHA) protein
MPALRYSTPQGDEFLPLHETVTIGRDASNDLALPDDAKVSHQHACIRQEGDTYVIEDLQSTNGTFLERESEVTRITSPQQLLPNDVIRVGSTRLAFEVPGETRHGRFLPVFMEPPAESAPSPQPAQPAAPPPQEAAQRIAELEQQLAELRAQLAKKPGES